LGIVDSSFLAISTGVVICSILILLPLYQRLSRSFVDLPHENENLPSEEGISE
jgi:hypothetical protein